MNEFRVNKITAAAIAAVILYFVLLLYLPTKTTCALIQSSGWQGSYGMQLYAGAFAALLLLAALRFKQKMTNNEAATLGLLVVLFIFFINVFYIPSALISECTGTVLSDNWWEALNWIKNNTKGCSVVATYWDPGHFITGIAKRSVVFDGASQSEVFYRPNTEGKTGIVIERHENGITRVIQYKNDTVVRARIQDISTTLLTNNESLAVEILKDYRKPGCEDEMYYIASSDLISKSQWWSYFATWDPTNPPNFGKRYIYVMIPLESSRPVLGQNAIAYSYRVTQNQAFVIYETNNTLKPFFQQQGQLLKVEKLFYFDRQGNGRLALEPDADVQGLLWLDGTRQLVIFIQPELEQSIFTRMFFFNGFGLERFEMVKDWGGEVKLFRVSFNETDA
ncbi:MAG: hypothetical protein HY368_01300 [Candidatus Aenigmarchaeota archaeon]|nr:hypothetical protein [Candidatus Aenigmarchaeota archaeon]